MPTLGDIVKGNEIGMVGDNHTFRWAACADCGLERWVRTKMVGGKQARCKPCSVARNQIRIGKGGQ
jgi:hypothetical protein